MPEHKHILVATLGGQPQVVTFTLDLLLQVPYPISSVIVLHPKAAQKRLQHALDLLHAEFVGDYYTAANCPMHFHSQVLELDGATLDDISENSHVDGTLNTIHALIGNLKRQEYRIHLSVSGGRRLMSLLAVSVAGTTPLTGERAQASLRGRPRGRLGNVGSGKGCLRGRPRGRFGWTQGAGAIL